MYKIQSPLKFMGLVFALCAALPAGSNAQISNCEACTSLYQVCLNT